MQQLSLLRWQARGDGRPDEMPEELARSLATFHRLEPPAVVVSYRRYTTLKSTARIAPDGRLVVSLCDELRADAPESQAAIAHVLAGRVLGRKAPAWAQEAYGAWLSDPRTRERSIQVRARRARRRMLAPQGAHHDLAPLLAEVARTAFDPPMGPPPVGWTPTRGRAVLASFDEAHSVITVSRLLDHPKVRTDTLRYLLYHELLHAADFYREGEEGRGASRAARFRRSLHPRSFRERLHRFPGWKEAEDDLARACRRRSVD